MSSTSATTPVGDHEFWLPREVWDKIFQHLTVFQLKQVRQTCSYLKITVNECPSFTGKVLLKLPESTTLDRFYSPEGLVPARSVQLNSCLIEYVDLWWPQLGRFLQDLHLRSCRISVTTLLGMLRQTPQLKQLKLVAMRFSNGIVERSVEDFGLVQLEELIIDYPDESVNALSLVSIFGSACPWLKSFSFLIPQPPREDQSKVVDFLEQVKSTIEELKLFYSDLLLDAIARMEGMDNLKRVSFLSLSNTFFENANDRTVLKFCRKYPNLEEFNMHQASIWHAAACWVIGKLKNLRRATVTLSSKPDPIERLPCVNSSLEYLSINTSRWNRATNFAGYRLPKLKELSISGMDMKIRQFAGLLFVSKQIHALTLIQCKLQENSGIYSILRILSSLRELSLDCVHLATWNHRNTHFVHSLKTLQLNNLTTSREQLLAIAEVFPQLEQLHLQDLPADDAVVRYLCQKLSHLRDLTIAMCPISDVATSFLGQHWGSLERLELTDNVGVTKCAIDRLIRDRPRNKVVVFKRPLTWSAMLKTLPLAIGHFLVCSPLTVVNCLLSTVGIKAWRPDFLRFKLADEYLDKSEWN